jgi:hypothetical protein
VATAFCRSKLLLAVDRFIRRNFDEFIGSPAFLELPIADLCCYFKHKNLKTKSEETLFYAALKWCKHNKKLDQFPTISEHIQFNLISIKVLCSALKDDPGIRSSEVVQSHILDQMQNLSNPITISRPRFSAHSLIAMPYRSKSFYAITFHGLGSIEFNIRDFPEIVNDHINALTNYSVCSFDNYLYLAGGTSYSSDNAAYNSDMGFLYNILNNTWRTGPRYVGLFLFINLN